MRTEVKTLIAALTTERNSIDRAIAALKQMSDSGEPQPAPVPRSRRGGWRRASIAVTTKAVIVAAMANAQDGNKFGVARRLGAQHGIKPKTIYQGWQRWEQQLGANGNVATPEPEYAATV